MSQSYRCSLYTTGENAQIIWENAQNDALTVEGLWGSITGIDSFTTCSYGTFAGAY